MSYFSEGPLSLHHQENQALQWRATDRAGEEAKQWRKCHGRAECATITSQQPLFKWSEFWNSAVLKNCVIYKCHLLKKIKEEGNLFKTQKTPKNLPTKPESTLVYLLAEPLNFNETFGETCKWKWKYCLLRSWPGTSWIIERQLILFLLLKS